MSEKEEKEKPVRKISFLKIENNIISMNNQISRREVKEEDDIVLEKAVTLTNPVEGKEKEREYDESYQKLLEIRQDIMEKEKKNKKTCSCFYCGKMKKNEKPDRQLTIIVLLLSLIMAIGFLTIYIFSKGEEPFFFTGSNLELTMKTLNFAIKNHENQKVLTGNLWRSRPANKIPYDCLTDEMEEANNKEHNEERLEDEDEEEDEESKKNKNKTNFRKVNGVRKELVCLVWRNMMKLKLGVRSFPEKNASCYDVRWSHDFGLTGIQDDCFDLGTSQWFGGGLINSEDWPLQHVKLEKSKFITRKRSGKEVAFGPVLQKYWILSNGVSISVAETSPISLSINSRISLKNKTDNLFCLYVDLEGKRLNNLEYSICVAPTIVSVHELFLSSFLSKSKDSHPFTLETFSFPFWSTRSLMRTRINQQQVLHFAKSISKKGYNHSFLLLDEGWEFPLGNLSFDSFFFQDTKNFFESLENLNFSLSLSIHDKMQIKADLFPEAADKGFLVQDSSDKVPSLSRLNHQLVGVLDLTGKGKVWMQRRLRNFQQKMGIQQIHFIQGEASSLPSNPSFKLGFSDINGYTKHLNLLASSFQKFSIVEAAYNSQNEGLIIRIPSMRDSWDGDSCLLSLIPSALSLGIIGYKLFLPEPVGGYLKGSFIPRSLYIRWMQINTFMPFMHFSIPPDHFGLETEELANQLFELRRTLVAPIIEKSFREKPFSTPIITPLWWFFPNDPYSLNCTNQFFVGKELLVAPILKVFDEFRSIYLPEGEWIDPVYDVIHQGPKWLKNYFIPLNSIAYFIKSSTV